MIMRVDYASCTNKEQETNLMPDPCLTPGDYLDRAARSFGPNDAVIYGKNRYSYAMFHARCRKLAHVLARHEIRRGDVVSILAANIPAMLEAHYAAPMLGAILNPLNTRLDSAMIRFCLEHCGAKILLLDCEYAKIAKDALRNCKNPPRIINIDDPFHDGARKERGEKLGEIGYEEVLQKADPDFQPTGPATETDPLAILYTSGTTGNPKGVIYTHRGACLAALSNAFSIGLANTSRYLWTLPMFHCCGWTFTWGVTAAGGVHVCLRKPEPAMIFRLLRQESITHLCGAPVILTMLVQHGAQEKQNLAQKITFVTGAAAPASATIAAVESLGFHVIHMYGATETYGPASICLAQPDWQKISDQARYLRMARQGVSCPILREIMIADPKTGQAVARDGKTMGEIWIRGHTVVPGYWRNSKANREAFQNGFYRSGDLAVWHEDGYFEVKDRSKDVIISGGENISSLEIEEILYRHPKILEAAIVARPDSHWGETVCAFITPKPQFSDLDEAEIMEFCYRNMARYKVPKTIVFCALPKTSTGKIQKFILRDKAAQLPQE